jgi:hypothetical protein
MLCPHIGRCASRWGPMGQGSAGGAGVLVGLAVGMDRQQHGEHSLDGRRAHPDRFLRGFDAVSFLR